MGNIFVFVPNGTIVDAVVNVPGAIQDSNISEWGGLYQKFGYVYDMNSGSIVVDSAFDRSRNKFRSGRDGYGRT